MRSVERNLNQGFVRTLSLLFRSCGREKSLFFVVNNLWIIPGSFQDPEDRKNEVNDGLLDTSLITIERKSINSFISESLVFIVLISVCR